MSHPFLSPFLQNSNLLNYPKSHHHDQNNKNSNSNQQSSWINPYRNCLVHAKSHTHPTPLTLQSPYLCKSIIDFLMIVWGGGAHDVWSCSRMAEVIEFTCYRWCFHNVVRRLLLLLLIIFPSHHHVLFSISSYYCKPRSYNFANIILVVVWEIAPRQVFACNTVSRFGFCSSSFG